MNSQHNQVNGINIGLMDKLILDLTRYIDDINDIFNSLDEEVTKSYSYIPSPVLETFKSNYCAISQRKIQNITIFCTTHTIIVFRNILHIFTDCDIIY